jgi:hypothetical protein
MNPVLALLFIAVGSIELNFGIVLLVIVLFLTLIAARMSN